MLLPRELGNKKNYKMEVDIGEVVSKKRLQSYKDSIEVAEYLRLHTYMLARTERNVMSNTGKNDVTQGSQYDPVIDPVSPSMLELEVSSLPEKQKLSESGDLKVFYANGTTQDISIRRFIGAGEETRVIDLVGGDRIIKKVQFIYRTPGKKPGRSIIQLWGMH